MHTTHSFNNNYRLGLKFLSGDFGVLIVVFQANFEVIQFFDVCKRRSKHVDIRNVVSDCDQVSIASENATERRYEERDPPETTMAENSNYASVLNYHHRPKGCGLATTLKQTSETYPFT